MPREYDISKRGTLMTRHSIGSLFDIIQQQDQALASLLEQNQRSISTLKKQLSISSKKNFNLEKDISALDKKIALLIKNRISLEEVLSASGDIQSIIDQDQALFSDKKQKELYGELFYSLREDARYIARLARLVKIGEIDNLLQTVMFTLYGNQYEESEEHLLLSMFQNVLSAEFNEATSSGNLLRANTALTRMMTTYTRRQPGQQYLKDSIAPVIQKVIELDEPLEINPSKVYEAWINEEETKTGVKSKLERKITSEEAAKHPETQKLCQDRLESLKKISLEFLEGIINTFDLVPYGIRWIMKQIRALAKAKFDDIPREKILSLVGGFFILRFVNPAIVSPQIFMNVESKQISPNCRRNLTLIAKVLQNIANNVIFGGKEFFMEPLNAFLEEAKKKLNDFFEGLTRVEDLDEVLKLDRYLNLGKTNELSINISLNEMYFIHGLLNTHAQEMVAISGNPENIVSTKLAALGEAPAQIPRKENGNVELALIASATVTDESVSQMRPEQLYSETKYLLFAVLKAIPVLEPAEKNNLKSALREIHKYATKNNDLELIEKIKKIMSNCNQLVDQKVLSVEDNYAQLRKDTLKEVMNYDHRIEKISKDQEQLQQVLDAIHERNDFLQQQYEAYHEYLDNVRKQCEVDEKGKDKKKDKKKEKNKNKAQSKGPFKFSHVQLQKDGVVIESGVPDERRSNIFFSFSSTSPGLFDVDVMYRSRSIAQMKLQLDELLEKQSNNDLELETDFLKLNINLLIHLLNKTFIQ